MVYTRAYYIHIYLSIYNTYHICTLYVHMYVNPEVHPARQETLNT